MLDAFLGGRVLGLGGPGEAGGQAEREHAGEPHHGPAHAEGAGLTGSTKVPTTEAVRLVPFRKPTSEARGAVGNSSGGWTGVMWPRR